MIDVDHFEVPEQPCRGCGALNNCATEVTENRKAPRKGDYAICAKCGFIEVYRADRSKRLPTKKEREEVESDPGIKRVLAAIRRMQVPGLHSKRWVK